MRQDLHKSNQRPKCPWEKRMQLTVGSILLSQLGKPTKCKSELSLAWTRRKGQMGFIVKILESSGLQVFDSISPMGFSCLALNKFLSLMEPQFSLL